MPEYAIIGGVVFAAVLAAGVLLLAGRRLFGSGSASETDKLNKDRASLQMKAATLEADLRNANARIEDLVEERRRQAAQLESLASERNQFKERIVQDAETKKHLEQRLADLREAKEQMRQEFGDVAGRLMKNHGEAFKEQNKEQIENLLTPFREQIKDFKNQVEKSVNDSRQQHGALAEKLNALSQQSATMSQETQNLTRALKGNVQMQGAWGEMVLETILSRIGFRKGEEYTHQESHNDADGNRLRTDYIIHLPDGERIIIDAKVSLKDFERFANADDEDERAAALAAHAASVRNHIKKLASKDYAAKAGSKLDYVIMFMPIEAALGAAMQHDEEILFFASDNKVEIATPNTLKSVLRTVASVWRVERQNRNAAEIAQRAGKLYDKFVGFLGDMGEIGDRLRQAGNAYDGAMNKLSQGRGNLVGQIERLKAMGAETNKSIPAEHLDDAPALSVEESESADSGPDNASEIKRLRAVGSE